MNWAKSMVKIKNGSASRSKCAMTKSVVKDQAFVQLNLFLYTLQAQIVFIMIYEHEGSVQPTH